MIQESITPPDEVIDHVMRAARKIATILPREAVTDVCPICLQPVIVRNCEVICVSGMCHWRLIESCSGG